MRGTRDSFLHYLIDNLPSIPIHNLRRDPDKPDADKLQMNAINVHFLNVRPDVLVGDTLVSVDVVNDTELAALDWVTQLWSLLSKTFFIPKQDYSNPQAPVSLHSNLILDGHAISFKPIFNDFYYHYNCLLKISHTTVTT